MTAGATFAQETHGLLPNPFDSASFNREIARLEPDYELQILLEQCHEDYKTQYRRLRDTEIADLADLIGRVRVSMMTPDMLDVIEQMLEKRSIVLNRFFELERSLFDAMAAHVPADRQSAFDRIRRTRQRQWYIQAQENGILDLDHVDLVRLVQELELPVAPGSPADQALVSWERSVNAALASFHNTANKLTEELIERFRAAGIDESRIDEDEWDEYFRMFDRMTRAVAQEGRKAGERVESIDARYARQLEGLLPPAGAEALRAGFLRKRYPDVYRDSTSPRELLAAALASDQLTSDQESQVQSIKSSWRGPYDAISDRMLELSAMRDRDSDAYDPNTDWAALHREIEAARIERDRLNVQTTDRLTSLLGDELVRSLRSGGAADKDLHIAVVTTVDGGMVQTGAVSLQLKSPERFRSLQRGRDVAIPQPISSDELDFYFDRLGLGDAQRTVGRTFFTAYRAAHDELIEADFDRMIGEPRANLHDEQHRIRPEMAEVLAIGRRTMLERIIELERAFFDEIDLVLDDEARSGLEAIRTARLLVCDDLGRHVRGGGGEPYIDLVGMIRALKLSPSELDGIEPALQAYESAALPHVREMYEAWLDREVANARMQEVWRLARERGNPTDARREYAELVRPITLQMERAAERLRSLEQTLLAELRRTLPGDALVAFEQRYVRAAYPDVYPDRFDAISALESALQLDSLSPQQREALRELESQHVREHARLSRLMVEAIDLRKQQPEFDSENSEAFIEWEKKTEMLETHRFDRRELSETTRRAIRAVLAEDQAAGVRGLEVEVK